MRIKLRACLRAAKEWFKDAGRVHTCPDCEGLLHVGLEHKCGVGMLRRRLAAIEAGIAELAKLQGERLKPKLCPECCAACISAGLAVAGERCQACRGLFAKTSEPQAEGETG